MFLFLTKHCCYICQFVRELVKWNPYSKNVNDSFSNRQLYRISVDWCDIPQKEED